MALKVRAIIMESNLFLERFRSWSTDHGRRFTDQVAEVTEEVASRSGFFTAAELSAKLRGRVSRATVYRALSRLTESGMVRRWRWDDEDWFVRVG